jgi:tetratricopeptide (TPR) repeat protein
MTSLTPRCSSETTIHVAFMLVCDTCAATGWPVSNSVDRSSLNGRWRAGEAHGQYVFLMGARDNYLELHLARGCAPHPESMNRELSDAISVRRFDDGLGMTCLEVCSLIDPPLAPAARLAALLAHLQQLLPGLDVHSDSRQEEEEEEALVADHAEAEGEADGQPAVRVPDRRKDQACRASLTECAVPDERLCSVVQVEDGPEDQPWWASVSEAVSAGRFKQAERAIRGALRNGEDQAADLLMCLTTLRHTAKVARHHPRSPAVHLSLAQAYYCMDAGEAACREAVRALQLDPTLGEAHALLGLELLYRNNRLGAVQCLGRAKALGSTATWTHALSTLLAETTADVPKPLEPGDPTVRLRSMHRLVPAACVPMGASRSLLKTALQHVRELSSAVRSLPHKGDMTRGKLLRLKQSRVSLSAGVPRRRSD